MICLENINGILDQLLSEYDSVRIEDLIRKLVDIARTDLNAVVDAAIARIKAYSFDGSKWSTLAFSILENLRLPDKAGEILWALVEYDENNGAYLNNYGIFAEMKGRIGQAIEWYARAYATDYRNHGHAAASTFPAWTNLHRIASSIR